MKNKIQKIFIGISIIVILAMGFMYVPTKVSASQNFFQKIVSIFTKKPTVSLGATNPIPTPIALFQTSLASSITSTSTSMTLVSATDKDGNTLNGTYAFIIDEGTSSEEFVNADCVSTSCTNMTRGLSVVTGTTSITALKKDHRRGSSVKITDAPQLLILSRIINGISTFPNKLSYTTHPTFDSDTQIIDKKYQDDLASTGAVIASDTAKGISKISVAPVSSTNPIAVGDNDPRVPTQGENDALVGTYGSPSSSNKFVTETDPNFTGIVKTTGNQTIAGIKTFSSIPVLPNSDPVNANDAVRKYYVDTLVAETTDSITDDGGLVTIYFNKRGKFYYNIRAISSSHIQGNGYACAMRNDGTGVTRLASLLGKSISTYSVQQQQVSANTMTTSYYSGGRWNGYSSNALNEGIITNMTTSN